MNWFYGRLNIGTGFAKENYMKVKAIITETPQHIEIVFTGISDVKRKKIEEMMKSKPLKVKV